MPFIPRGNVTEADLFDSIHFPPVFFFKTWTRAYVCQVVRVEVLMACVWFMMKVIPLGSFPAGGIMKWAARDWCVLLCRAHLQTGCVSANVSWSPKGGGGVIFPLVPPPQGGQGSRSASEDHHLIQEKFWHYDEFFLTGSLLIHSPLQEF